MSSPKQLRTAEHIRQILSELLLRDVNDPRLVDVTITRVEIDRELQHANIYVNALADEERNEEVMQALDRANGFFRREVAQRVQLRRAPELHFHWDPTLAYAEEVNRLLDSLDIPPAEDEAPNSSQS